MPKDKKKFKIDNRFKAVLTDDRFRVIDGNGVLCVWLRGLMEEL